MIKSDFISAAKNPLSLLRPRKTDDGRINKQWLLIVIIVAVFVIIGFAGGAAIAFEMKYQDRFSPGTHLGELRLEGLTKEQARAALEQETAALERDGIKISYRENGNLYLKITPTIEGMGDPDLSRRIIDFDNKKTIETAWQFAHSDSWYRNFINQLTALTQGQNFSATFTLDETALKKIIRQEFLDITKPAINARPIITWSGDNYQIKFTGEQDGYGIDEATLIAQLKKQLAGLSTNVIEITKQSYPATITLTEAQQTRPLIDQLLVATSTPTLTFETRNWTMSRSDFTKILELQKDETGTIRLGLNYLDFKQWLEKIVAPQINVEPQNAKASLENGKIVSLVAHRDGLSIDLEQTYQTLNENFINRQWNTNVVVKETKASVTTDSINNLGIKEIIGTGTSNFAGSPANRRHNIKNGASKLNGVLIAPNEEFSLIKTLGAVDGTTGYLTELVIKENKTTPEFGGGLCQIGTTTFRAALASGLPITERRNHSYNVTYYLENGLPGVDATIYIPKPDVRFINDTGNYILIQTRITGNDLYFDFWGTSDGRAASRTKPRVWNWVSPPATKYVETLDLKPGTKKCTESSHKGVDAAFDYTVTYPNGEVKKTTFSSHYRPWQAVCLVGVEKLSDNPPTDGATSTPATISAPVN